MYFLGHLWPSNPIFEDFASGVRSREQFSRELEGTKGSFSMKQVTKNIRKKICRFLKICLEKWKVRQTSCFLRFRMKILVAGDTVSKTFKFFSSFGLHDHLCFQWDWLECSLKDLMHANDIRVILRSQFAEKMSGVGFGL